jgi:hypothetical protein
MSKRFLTHVDLTGNQLIKSSFEKLSNDPNSGNFSGRMYYNTASASIRFYDGSQWVPVGKSITISGTENEVDVNTVGDSYTISLPATISANLNGNASTASQLANARTISLGGDLSGSASFNGSSDITISADIQPNSVTLGTDTTGDYVASVSGSGAGISVSGSGEGAAVTISNTGVTSLSGTANEVEVSASAGSVTVGLPDDVIITRDLTVTRNAVVNGDFTVNGTTTTINTENLNVEDNIITLNSNLSASVSPTLNAGIEINRGSENDVQLRWNESLDTWQATRDGSTYKEIVLAGDSISASVVAGFDEAAQDAIGNNLGSGFVYNDSTGSIGVNQGQMTTLVVTGASGNSYGIVGNSLYLDAVTPSGYNSEIELDISAVETKLLTDGFAKKVSANVGNAGATSFAITHNLGTRDIQVQVYDNATYDTVECDVIRTDSNNVTLSFSVAPANNAYRVVIIG